MTSDPLILVLEDERAQILTLRSQLAGLGKLVEFTDPEPALDYARSHACDAAIVDVRMPRSSMDGLAFLKALREFDRDLAIIIRTASDSDQIADKAIELRAVKRAVKSKTTLAELRISTQDAIRDTRERRQTTRRAKDTEATQTKLVEALGSYDLRLAAADVHRGLVHSLRSRLTALSALASVLKADAVRSGNRAFADHAQKSADLVGGMVDSVNAFLDGPFGDGSEASRAAVNVCLAALSQFFQGAERWAQEEKRLTVRDLISDTFVEATQMAGRLAQASVVLNREAIRVERPYVVIRISGAMGDMTVDSIRDAFNFGVQSGRTGNLNVLGQLLLASRGAALIGASAPGAYSVDTVFPVAL
jgi:CheY-like chemotaxis protein